MGVTDQLYSGEGVPGWHWVGNRVGAKSRYGRSLALAGNGTKTSRLSSPIACSVYRLSCCNETDKRFVLSVVRWCERDFSALLTYQISLYLHPRGCWFDHQVGVRLLWHLRDFTRCPCECCHIATTIIIIIIIIIINNNCKGVCTR
jgi:hypothetical protein